MRIRKSRGNVGYTRNMPTDRESARERDRRYRERNPERARELARERQRRYRELHPERVVESRITRKDQQREYNRQRYANARSKIFDHYGWSCACCGSIERLTIDHVDGNGSEHRAAIGGLTGIPFYLWLIRNGFPAGYQTLCDPCNRSKNRGQICELDHAS